MNAFRTLPLPPFPVGATFCSGIGAPEVAVPEIDWRFASEIEPFPRAVLEQRLGYRTPEAQNQGEPLLWGDMATIEPETFRSAGVPLPDVLVAGTPCQAFSLAGLRGGVADPRGNLTLKFVGICHAIQDAKSDGRLFVVWENVPGVLSDRGNAFGCFLAGLVGGDAPLRTPDGKSWPGAGMVAGPRGRAAWLVRDAQYFGLAQRRRRVFVVASLGDGPDPAAILFERQGGDGNPAAGGETPAGHVDAIRDGNPVCGATGPVAHTLTAGGFDASEDGTGREAPVVAIEGGFLIPSTGHTAHCLNAGGMGRCDYETETLVAFNARQDPIQYGDLAGPLDVKGNTIAIAGGLPYYVRRLTPRECHRLQGFPDDHCAIEWRGKPAPDGPQYKALGNSMAVPVMRWILGRALGVPVTLQPFTGPKGKTE